MRDAFMDKVKRYLRHEKERIAGESDLRRVAEAAEHDYYQNLRNAAAPILDALHTLQRLGPDRNGRCVEVVVHEVEQGLGIYADFRTEDERHQPPSLKNMKRPEINFIIRGPERGDYVAMDEIVEKKAPHKRQRLEHIAVSIDDMMTGLAKWAGRHLIHHPGAEAKGLAGVSKASRNGPAPS